MEVIHNLLGYKNLKIAQNTEWFNFSLDSVILAHFISIRTSTKKIMDLGTGNAPIPIILSTRTKAKIYGVEIQESVYDLACKSINMNNLGDQITIINEDAKVIDRTFETDTFDVITVNPPYFKINDHSIKNKNQYKTIARHEILLTIDDILRVSKKLLKNNGIFGIVHRPERLLEILTKMKDYNIEPKRIQFIYPKKDLESNMVVIEGSRNGNPGLKILPPLIVHDNKGNYTKEIKKMFRK